MAGLDPGRIEIDLKIEFLSSSNIEKSQALQVATLAAFKSV